MKGFWAAVVILVSRLFIWIVGQKPVVSDAEGPGKLEDKLKDKIKKDGWK